MATETRLKIVPEEAPAPPTPPTTRPQVDAVTVLRVILAVLSERALPFLLAGMGFILWRSVLPAPSYEQLVGLALYGAFALATLIIRRG